MDLLRQDVILKLIIKHHDDVVSQGATDERMHSERAK